MEREMLSEKIKVKIFGRMSGGAEEIATSAAEP